MLFFFFYSVVSHNSSWVYFQFRLVRLSVQSCVILLVVLRFSRASKLSPFSAQHNHKAERKNRVIKSYKNRIIFGKRNRVKIDSHCEAPFMRHLISRWGLYFMCLKLTQSVVKLTFNSWISIHAERSKQAEMCALCMWMWKLCKWKITEKPSHLERNTVGQHCAKQKAKQHKRREKFNREFLFSQFPETEEAQQENSNKRHHKQTAKKTKEKKRREEK